MKLALPLTAAEIEEQLDHFLDSVLSSRRVAAESARRLSEFERGQQEFVIKWVEIVARSNNPELAYQLTSLAPEALPLVNEQAMEAWIVHAMDMYDRSGLCASIDEEGNEYLPHLYGPVNYTVISEVKKLPLKVSDIYRRLTT